PEPEVVPMPDIPAPADPNAKMSPDDIAALLASMNPEEAAEEPAILEPAMEDPVMEETATEEPILEESVVEEAASEPSAEGPVDVGSLLDGLDMSILEEDLDQTSMDPLSMTEEDLEKRMNMAREEGEKEEISEQPSDLNELLKESGEEDFSEIGDMLDKSDQNIAVGNEIEDLLNPKEEPDYAAMALSEDQPTQAPAGEDKAAERKRLREEKKEAKRLAREKKAREKAEKKAKKSGKKSASDEEAGDALTGSELSEVEELLRGADEAAGAGSAGAPSAEEAGLDPDQMTADEMKPFALDDLSTEGSASSEDDELAALLSGAAEAPDDSFGDLDFSGEPASEEASAPVSEGDLGFAEELASIEDRDAPKKKKGFFAKILDLLTEEEEEEPSDKDSLKLSDENAEILEELDLEGEQGKGGKKKKKKDKKGKKDKKDKKGKGEETPEEGEEDSEGGEDTKKKKKKEKKPKKEKPPKDENAKPEKKLNKKAVLLIALICISFGVLLFVGAHLAGSYTTKKAARDAYYQGDYQTCYQNLFGKELNETETVMFNKSECILRIRLWLREYEILSEESEVRALDVLIQSVNVYPSLYRSAVEWNCAEEVSSVYNEMVDILNTKYRLTVDEALAIAAQEDDVIYTRLVTAAAQGYGYAGNYQTQEQEEPAPEPEPEPMPDELPEEQEMDGSTFVEPN
ncbi:MAG: hypothetical protein K6E81_08655, partial [Lachnospiraceae bacterium]|nr:hypothetical protein [Lachnospiraceae bacterium]